MTPNPTEGKLTKEIINEYREYLYQLSSDGEHPRMVDALCDMALESLKAPAVTTGERPEYKGDYEEFAEDLSAYIDKLLSAGHKNNEFREKLWFEQRDKMQAEIDFLRRAEEKRAEKIEKMLPHQIKTIDQVCIEHGVMTPNKIG